MTLTLTVAVIVALIVAPAARKVLIVLGTDIDVQPLIKSVQSHVLEEDWDALAEGAADTELPDHCAVAVRLP